MTTHADHRGFTLIETVVASIIGAVVLMGCFSMFAATGRMDRAFASRFEHTADLNITQQTMRRAFLSLQMQEEVAVTVADETDVNGDPKPLPRDRIILDLDLSAGEDESAWKPQRFEVVLNTPPIAMNLASASAGWVRMLDQDESLDFSSPDGSGGAMRSVFELRRTDTREDIMFQMGLIEAGTYALMTGHDPKNQSTTITDKPAPEGWSLWWRPILRDEDDALSLGYSPLSDVQGTTDQIRTRLAGAIRIAKGIRRARWQLFKGDVMIDQFSGSTMLDLPAYTQFEVQMLSGQYATWMFEVDWVIGDDPNDAEEDEEANNTGGAGGTGGNTNNPGGTNNGDTTGGGIRPGGNTNGNTYDVGGGNREGRRRGDERE